MLKTDSIIYRKAIDFDAKDIVNINLNGWRTSYMNIVSLKTIEARFSTYASRVLQTIEEIGMYNNYYVAEIDNRVIGYIHYGASQSDLFKNYGEIKALFILNEYHHRGIGQSLFNYATNELRNLGFKQVFIDCLKANSANAFYLKMGTRIDSIKEENFMNEILIENVHVMNL